MDNKLNFFQRQLKKYYLSRIESDIDYEKLPEFLKKDEDILTEYFKNKSRHTKYILKSNPAAIRIYINIQGLSNAYSNINKDYVKYLTEEEQKEFLKEAYFYNSTIRKIFGSDISAFSDEVLIEAFNEFAKENTRLDYPEIRLLPISCQKEVIKNNQEFIRNVSKETLLEFVNDNPLLIHYYRRNLPEEYDKIFLESNLDDHRYDKILSDNYLVSVAGKDNLIQFFKNFESIKKEDVKHLRELFIQFIEENYNESIKNIFIERPELITQSLEYIPTFSLFNPKIVEYFGLNMINQFLSYNDFEVEAPIITRLANDEDFFENFKKYSVFSESNYSNTPEDIFAKLKTFNNFYELFSSIDNYDELDEDIKNNLFLAINDFENLNLELLTSHIKNIEDIKNYKEYRDRMLGEFIEKCPDSSEVKNAIFKKYFSVEYKDGVYVTLTGLYYNAFLSFGYLDWKKLASNQELIDKININQEIIDTIELMDILRNIKDITILKKLNSELASQENIINPFDISDLNKEIISEYSQQLTNSLLTLEEVKEKCNKGEDGISYREEDGFKIISLTGTNFTLCTHVVNLGIPNGGNPVSDIDGFNTREASSTLSTSIYTPYNVSHFLSKEFEDKRIIIGFTDFSSSQVVGMGYGDIGVSHENRKLMPTFSMNEMANISFDNPISLSIKNYAYDTGYSIEKGDYSGIKDSKIERGYEVTLRRRKLDNNNPEKGTGGGKIQPSYMIVPIGQAKEYYAEAKKWNVDTIIEVDIEAYKDVYHRMEDYGYKKQEERAVEKSDYIKEVQKMVGELNGQSSLQGKTK